MSLNDEALNELHDDGEYLTHAEGQVVSLGDATVITDDETGLLPPKNIDEAVEKLSDYDVKIQTNVDKVVKLHDLQDVADTVLASESIGQSDAKEIERTYGGLYDNVATRQEYSEVPTKVNLAPTQDYVAQRLGSYKEDAVASCRAYIEETYEAAVSLNTFFHGGAIAKVVALFEELQQTALADLPLASKSNKFLHYRKTKNTEGQTAADLTDLRRVNLYFQNFQEEFLNASSELPSKETIGLFKDSFSNDTFRSLVKIAESSNSAGESLLRSQAYYNREEHVGYDYLALLGFLAEGRFISFFTEAMKELDAIAKDAEVAVAAIRDVNQVTDDVLSGVQEKMSAMGMYYSCLLSLERYRLAASTFGSMAKQIVSGFSKVLHA